MFGSHFLSLIIGFELEKELTGHSPDRTGLNSKTPLNCTHVQLAVINGLLRLCYQAILSSPCEAPALQLLFLPKKILQSKCGVVESAGAP